MMSLADVFDRRRNALTLWRLFLAIGVVFWHSWPLTGREIGFVPAVRLLSDMFADGFFIISGFLITAAWFRRPYLKEYWASRGLRIFPGLWVCVVLIAFVAAPIAAKATNTTITLSSEIWYVVNNAVLNIAYANIDGTPTDVPYPGIWNGSIWTLFFVLLCDLMVSVLGFVGLLKRRWTIPTLFVAAVCWCAYVSYTPPGYSMAQMLARFAVVFLAGAMFYQYQHKIPANWWLVALGAGIVVASSFTQNYRLIGALPLAYAIIVSGVLVKRSRLTNDLSYGVYIYAFPVQQLLATFGLAALNPFLFFGLSTAAVMPIAAGSWFLVEKRASNLKSRIFRKSKKAAEPSKRPEPAVATGTVEASTRTAESPAIPGEHS
ncbi:acyltransferase [Mycolicibacterium smegmatis]|uniref:O-acyl transferase n=3 Tax=Mycolicibacterium smegmatis TaxID=1772 RepID=A0QXU5_MYCS2|nr:O-acyl transferase [Mycolicibacterium smegmatis MC2 155]AIU15195.1 acyltransferase [Mycolicibacterium smegmatis]AFP39813.1 Acyltransferase 3 [Mycolicibacterium smegmatis MC2 155]AIU08570.1 acyltransferase [Mycolicibacterium smegmatis MC2 155]AIU21818.1 acyltransferase [Mycolicibacterium smegmatis]